MFYGTEGWMEINGSSWKAYYGRENEPFAGSGMDAGDAAVGGDTSFRAAPGGGGHFSNFIAALKSGNRSDLTCDILKGHMSTCLPHLGNIA